MTEHEKMFSEQGIPIKFLIAKKLTINPSEKEASECENCADEVEISAENTENSVEN
jgi:hypothetical protein